MNFSRCKVGRLTFLVQQSAHPVYLFSSHGRSALSTTAARAFKLPVLPSHSIQLIIIVIFTLTTLVPKQIPPPHTATQQSSPTPSRKRSLSTPALLTSAGLMSRLSDPARATFCGVDGKSAARSPVIGLGIRLFRETMAGAKSAQAQNPGTALERRIRYRQPGARACGGDA